MKLCALLVALVGVAGISGRPQDQQPNSPPCPQETISQGADRPGSKQKGAQTNKVPLYLDPNLTLSKISQDDLTDFLSTRCAVHELVNCFVDRKICKEKSGTSLVNDVRSLGRGGQCKRERKCSKEEETHKRQLVGRAVAQTQRLHPVEWRRLLPYIGFLL